MAASIKQSMPLRHGLMQARARVLMDPRDVSLRRLQSSDAVAAASLPSERLGAFYASALASTQLRDWPRADAALERAETLLRTSPQPDAQAERELQWLRVQSLVARGDAARGLALAQELGDDGSRSALLLRAQAASAAALKGGPPAQAALRESVEALQTWVAVHRNDATAWTQLAQSADQAGLKLRAVRAEAEARAAIGDFSGAIDRLRAAQRLSRNAASGDFIDASIIDARLRDLEAQRRELMAELRGDKRGGREPDQ
jgi:predicted Zn-dependent protease